MYRFSRIGHPYTVTTARSPTATISMNSAGKVSQTQRVCFTLSNTCTASVEVGHPFSVAIARNYSMSNAGKVSLTQTECSKGLFYTFEYMY